jgi:hypothetical protein
MNRGVFGGWYRPERFPHLSVAAQLRRDVRLKYVEIASGARNTHFKKCAWRGVAHV